ncbi:MAG: AtpZ/AtpI family protein [Holophagales bacterium]|jgi:F0F1-type ATP synthase assembly protein I|nr:AtpZ/AtpI family protein [Holophagales bacterium]
MYRPSKKDGVGPKERSLWGDLISIGMVFPIAIVLGWYLGQWIGGMLGHPRHGRLIGLAFGVISGFWELFKVARRLEKFDDLNKIDNGSEEDANDGSNE